MLYNKYSWYNLLRLILHTHIKHEKEDAPIIKFFSKHRIAKMFRNFRKLDFDISGLPMKTFKRHGIFADLYNNIFVPISGIVPENIVKHFGSDITIKAIK